MSSAGCFRLHPFSANSRSEVQPLAFDKDLFGTLRPNPSIILAEFDRRTALRSMLRSKYGIVDESRGTGGRNRSPEVTAFILFFATFTGVIGKELANVARRSVAAPQQQSIQGTIGLGA